MTEFKSKQPQNYNYGEVTTPFNQNNQRWDHPIGEKLEKASKWRVYTITLLSIALILVFLILVTTNTFKINVLTSQVSKSGFVISKGVLTKPENKNIDFQILKITFIKNILESFFKSQNNHKFMSEDSFQKLNFLKKENLKFVKIANVKPLGSNIFIINYDVEQNGVILKRSIKAIVATKKVTDNKDLNINPLQLFLQRVELKAYKQEKDKNE